MLHLRSNYDCHGFLVFRFLLPFVVFNQFDSFGIVFIRCASYFRNFSHQKGYYFLPKHWPEIAFLCFSATSFDQQALISYLLLFLLVLTKNTELLVKMHQLSPCNTSLIHRSHVLQIFSLQGLITKEYKYVLI